MESSAPSRTPRRVALAGLVGVAVLVVPVGAVAPALAAAPTAAPAPAPPRAPASGDWWFDKLRVADAHRVSTGAGVTIGLIDGPTDPTVPGLVGQRLVPVRGFCGAEDGVTSTGFFASHATQIARLLIGNGKDGHPPGIAPDATVRSYVVDEGIIRTLACRDRSNFGLPEEHIARGIDAAVADKVDIINISLGFAASPATTAALRRAYDAGIPVIAAAGNTTAGPDYNNQYPASDPTVVCVTAVTEQADPWSGDVTGPYSRVAAPGVDLALGKRLPDDRTWNPDTLVTGTSYASPLVAGALALVDARYPGATRDQLVRHLVTHTSAPELMQTSDLGFGIISLSRLLADDPHRQLDDDPFLAHGVSGVDIASLAATRPVGAVLPAPRTPEATSESGGVPVLLVAGGGVALAGAFGGVALLTRRRRSTKEA